MKKIILNTILIILIYLWCTLINKTNNDIILLNNQINTLQELQLKKRLIPCEKRHHNLSDAIEDNRDCIKNYNFYYKIEIDTANKEFPVKYVVR